MHWEYSQSTRVLTFNGMEVATGYAGKGAGKNNPDMEQVRNVGPIPTGKYEIQAPFNSKHTSPYALPLSPIGHNALGRTAFQIHGDSNRNPGTASEGCIILGPQIRRKIWNSGVRTLVVVE